MRLSVCSRLVVKLLLHAVAVCFLVPTNASAAGDASAGLLLARQWCTGCHVVDAAGSGSDAAPAFPLIAREHGADQSWIRTWLTAPHPRMPNLNLSRTEIDDINSYLQSLTRP